jgi:hypothetical protein
MCYTRNKQQLPVLERVVPMQTKLGNNLIYLRTFTKYVYGDFETTFNLMPINVQYAYHTRSTQKTEQT